MTFCSIATNLVKIFINFLKRGMFPHEQSVMIKKCVSLHKFFYLTRCKRNECMGFCAIKLANTKETL